MIHKLNYKDASNCLMLDFVGFNFKFFFFTRWGVEAFPGRKSYQTNVLQFYLLFIIIIIIIVVVVVVTVIVIVKIHFHGLSKE